MKYLFGLFIGVFGCAIANAQTWKPRAIAGFHHSNKSISSCDVIIAFIDTSKIIDPCNLAADSCDSIIDWNWDFGDGKKSKLLAPVHEFVLTGYYTITLTIKTKFGYSDSAYLTIFKSGPSPKFKVLSDTILELGDTAYFENTSHDPLYYPSWIWNFGDNSGVYTNTIRQGAYHEYKTTGTFNVSLAMFDNLNGTNIRCKSSYPDTTFGQHHKISITVINATKIKNAYHPKLSIVPNPAKDYIQLKGYDKGNVMVCDIYGKEILTLANPSEFIDISMLAKGIYVVKYISGGHTLLVKFIKN